MDTKEAHRLINAKIDELRQLPYDALVGRFLDQEGEVDEITGANGVLYSIETMGFWDDKRRRTLRVASGIDDGGLRAIFPLTQDFIIAPDGSFVGE